MLYIYNDQVGATGTWHSLNELSKYALIAVSIYCAVATQSLVGRGKHSCVQAMQQVISRTLTAAKLTVPARIVRCVGFALQHLFDLRIAPASCYVIKLIWASSRSWMLEGTDGMRAHNTHAWRQPAQQCVPDARTNYTINERAIISSVRIQAETTKDTPEAHNCHSLFVSVKCLERDEVCLSSVRVLSLRI